MFVKVNIKYFINFLFFHYLILLFQFINLNFKFALFVIEASYLKATMVFIFSHIKFFTLLNIFIIIIIHAPTKLLILFFEHQLIIL